MTQAPAHRPSPNEIIEALPKDQLRSLFYLFAAKPDSRIKIYSEPIHLELADIIELNDCISRKLKTHKIDASMTSVKVGYLDADVNEFGTWVEFAQHHWQEPERIEELVVKWDFLVNIEEYGAPQRHTLLYRVSNDVKPGKVLQMLISGNADEFENLDMIGAPAFCRVDFINAQLSKELINVITDWHKARRSPKLIPDIYYNLKKRRQQIAEGFDYLLYFSLTLILAGFYYWGAVKFFDSELPVHISLSAIFVGFFFMRVIGKIANSMAKIAFNSLGEIDGSKVVFEFTSGDKKHIAEKKQENKNQGMKFIWSITFNIALNLIASGIYAYFFTSGSTQ
jgi:hypothetical protein